MLNQTRFISRPPRRLFHGLKQHVPAPSRETPVLGPMKLSSGVFMRMNMHVPPNTAVVVVTGKQRKVLTEGVQHCDIGFGFYDAYSVSLRKFDVALPDIQSTCNDGWNVKLSLRVFFQISRPALITCVEAPLEYLKNLSVGEIHSVLSSEKHDVIAGSPEKTIASRRALSTKMKDAISQVITPDSIGVQVLRVSIESMEGDSHILAPRFDAARDKEQEIVNKELEEKRGEINALKAQSDKLVAEFIGQIAVIKSASEKAYDETRAERQRRYELQKKAMDAMEKISANILSSGFDAMESDVFQSPDMYGGEMQNKFFELATNYFRSITNPNENNSVPPFEEEILSQYHDYLNRKDDNPDSEGAAE